MADLLLFGHVSWGKWMLESRVSWLSSS